MRVPYKSSSTHVNHFFANLNEYFHERIFCDLTFNVGVEKFPCHRIIVASASPYFQALLTHRFKENQQQTIDLVDINASVFSLLLQYIYSGQIEIDVDYVQDLFIASDMLQMDEVFQFCCHYLSISLSEDNAIDTWKLAEEFQCSSLKNEAENYLLTHFCHLIRRDRIKDLPKFLFLKLISHDDLIVDHEQQVLEAILIWFLNNEGQDFDQLFGNVRFEYISREHQTMILHRISLANPNFVHRIEQLISQREYSSVSSPARRGMKQTCYLFGGYGSSVDSSNNHLLSCSYRCHLKTSGDSSSLYAIEFEEISGDEMRYPRMHHQAVGLGSLIYIVGGEDGDNIFNSVKIFDPLAKQTEHQWKSTSSMLTPRCNFGLVACDSTSLYALGGHIGADLTSTIEKFDSRTGLWTLLPYRLKSPCYGFVCVHLNGTIFCIGGSCIFNLPVKSTEVFNPRTGQSYFCTDMFEARSFASACVDENQEKIYVFGGADSNGNALRTVEVYHSFHCRWSQLPSMLFSRINPCVYRMASSIFVFGGRTNLANTEEILNSAEVFDIDKNLWMRIGDLPIRLYGAATILR